MGVVIAGVTAAGLAPAATGAPPEERRVAAEATFAGVVERAKARDGECRARLRLDDVQGRTQGGREFAGTGRADVRYPCTAAPQRGDAVTGAFRAILNVASSQGGTPDGYRAQVAPRDVRNIDLDIASSQGGTPDGFRATLEVATTAGGNPQG